MATMTTIHDKLLDMLANIKEIRKYAHKKGRIAMVVTKKKLLGGNNARDAILATIPDNEEIEQGRVIQLLKPVCSERTTRRYLRELLSDGKIISSKDGRLIKYRKSLDYPQ